MIASCKFEGVKPGGGFGGEIIIGTVVAVIPTPTDRGKPENISGTLLIADNDIDDGGPLSTIWEESAYSVWEYPAQRLRHTFRETI